MCVCSDFHINVNIVNNDELIGFQFDDAKQSFCFISSKSRYMKKFKIKRTIKNEIFCYDQIYK